MPSEEYISIPSPIINDNLIDNTIEQSLSHPKRSNEKENNKRTGQVLMLFRSWYLMSYKL